MTNDLSATAPSILLCDCATTRANPISLFSCSSVGPLDIRKYAFSQRTIHEWNRLPGECVNATSVNMFKNKIDNYFKRSGYV